MIDMDSNDEKAGAGAADVSKASMLDGVKVSE